MVQLSPDTRLETWDGCSGYHYSDAAIFGFSHTHLSGTGCADLGDIRVIPLTKKELGLKSISDYKMPFSHASDYKMPFSHAKEMARPGYYSVELDEPTVKVELTATAHAGLHRYNFPADGPARLVFDLFRGISSRPAEGRRGLGTTPGCLAAIAAAMVGRPTRPFSLSPNSRGLPIASAFDVDGKVAGSVGKARGRRFWPSFLRRPQRPVLVKVGISAVSVEAARKNLAAEIPGLGFPGNAWPPPKRFGPNCWADRDRNSRPRRHARPSTRPCITPPWPRRSSTTSTAAIADWITRCIAKADFRNYCTFSLWDTFRAEHPLLTIIQPQRVDDFVNSHAGPLPRVQPAQPAGLVAWRGTRPGA